MKLYPILTALLCLTISFYTLGGDKEIPKKPNNWQPIVGFKMEGQRAYIDANSHITTRSTDSGEEYNYGEILISSDKILEFNVGQKKIKARSMVKQMIIECNSGLMAPVYDLYFETAMPSRISIPLAGIEYSDVRTSAKVLQKDSLLYRVLCPVYI